MSDLFSRFTEIPEYADPRLDALKTVYRGIALLNSINPSTLENSVASIKNVAVYPIADMYAQVSDRVVISLDLRHGNASTLTQCKAIVGDDYV